MKVPAIFICILINIFLNVTAQETCPKERVNCTHHCRRYTDENKNDTCDLSEAYIKSIAQKSIALQPKIPELPKADSPVITPQTENTPVAAEDNSKNTTQGKKTAGSLKAIVAPTADTDIQRQAVAVQGSDGSGKHNKPGKKNTSPYHFITVSVATMSGYVLSMILVAVHFIKRSMHRKFWNLILLVSFLISGLLGIFLAIQINYDLPVKNLTPYYLLHVDAGIIMAILSLIHFYWHRKYYYVLFRK